MTSIDSRIVTMKFDNAQFQSAAAATMSVLEKLKSSISSLGSTNGLGNISAAANKTDLSGLGSQVDGISAKFVALGTVAVTALANITNRAVDSGLALANSLTFAPINAGLKEYETNLNAVQTILANTSAAGTNLDDVNAALDELNEFSDQTIYNFSEMAKNIGTFTAAGVGLETATASIKGIANLAALSGSNSQQASTAMYQLSQAISAGRVSLQDWNSVVNAGMGGAVFQRALAQTAVAMGAINEDAVSLQGEMKNVVINGQSFRESISTANGQPSWLTGEVLTTTLKQFTGDLNDAELAAIGFSEAQIKAIQDQAQMAKDAATKVKTLTQLIDVARETAQSGWAETWRYIFGDFEEARETFTLASERVNGFINAMSDARNSVLKDWKAMGGRAVLFEGIANIFQALINVIKPIRNAFRDIFPPLTGERLFAITEAFERFTGSLVASGPTMKNIRTIFQALFSVLDIGLEIIFGIVKYIASFFGLVFQGTGGVLDLAAAMADIVNHLIGWVSEGNLVTKFFDTLIAGRAAVLGPIIEFLSDILSALAGIVSIGADFAFDRIADAVEFMTPYLKEARDYLVEMGGVIKDKIADAFDDLRPTIEKIRDAIVETFQVIRDSGDDIKSALSFDIGGGTSAGGSFLSAMLEDVREFLPTMDQVKAAFNDFVGLMKTVGTVIGAALLAPFYLIGQGAEAGAEQIGGFGSTLMGVIEVIGEFLSKAGSFVRDILPSLSFAEIVTFINTVLVTAILAGFARVQLGLGKMLGAFGGFAVELRNVVGEKGILGQLNSNLQSMQNNIRADTILKIAGAVALLAGSLFILSKIAPADIAKGLGAIAALMAGLTLMIGKLVGGGGQVSPKKMANQALGLVALAGAMAIMAGAITALSAAVAIFGNMDEGTLVRGITSVTAIMGLFTAMAVILGKSGFGAAGAAGILGVATAMTIMAGALLLFTRAISKYAKFDTSDLFEGIGKIAAVIVALGLAMNFLNGGIGGAIAIGILALSLQLLIPTLVKLSEIGWGTILKGAGILAVALGIIGAAAYVVGPALIILGSALALMGVGMLAFGLGVAAFGAGLAVLAGLGGTAAVLLTAYIRAIIDQIPLIAEGIGKGIAAISKVIVQNEGKIRMAIGSLLNALFGAIEDALPQIGKTLRALIQEGLRVLRSFYQDFLTEGFKFIMFLLRGITNNAERLARGATRAVIAFASAFGDRERVERIVDAGAKMVINILEGIAQGIENNAEAFGAAGGKIGAAVIRGIVDAIRGASDEISGAIRDSIPGAGFVGGIVDGLIAEAKGSGGTKSTYTPPPPPESAPMERSMAELGAAAAQSFTDAADIDANPTITPILDLTQVSAEANKLSQIFGETNIGTASYSRAAQLSSDTEAARVRAAEVDTTPQTILQFQQTNNSPKSLSTVDIYRDTKGILAIAKEALK